MQRKPTRRARVGFLRYWHFRPQSAIIEHTRPEFPPLMLLLGRQTQRTCQTLSRRSFLQVGASSVLGLSLADALRAADGRTPGSAKAVVLLWLWGGPSQLDTFDPKPNAQLEYRGPFGTIPTRVPGVRFTELFPKLAGVADKLHQGKKAIIGEGGGPLGAMYDPFRLEYDPATGTKVPALQLPPELTPERLADRQRLLNAFGQAESRSADAHAAGALDDYRSRAFAMLTNPTAAARFDL